MAFQTVRGMRDFLPEEARRKQFIEDRIKREFEAYGFEPLETPVIEDFALLAAKGGAGEAIKEEIYYFKDKGNRELGLRFDLTVPLARVVASNPQLVKPFKRYQIGKVYRYDRPGAKRYREFTQADADIVGSTTIMADFEILALAYKTMKNLGLKFYIRVSNRNLLEDLAAASGVEKAKMKDCFRSLDKLDKIGLAGVKRELSEKKIPQKILDLLQKNDISGLEKLLKESQGLKEVKELLSYCQDGGLAEFVKFDSSLARGLEYYTGNVFEVCLESGPSVGGGGRYDNLIETFGGPKTPAVGISFGIERLLESLEGKELYRSKTQLLVVQIGLEEGKESLRIARELRGLGLNVENDLMQRSLGKNIEYANKKGIPLVVIVGEDELEKKEVSVKDLKTGKQLAIKLSKLEKIKELL